MKLIIKESLVFLLFVADFIGSSKTATISTDQYNYCESLIANVVDNSNTYVVIPPTIPTTVTTNVVINSLTGINDNTQTLTLTFLLHLSWMDKNFTLTDPNCTNVDYRFIVEKALFLDWFPHIILANNRKVMYHDAWLEFPAVVYTNGTVTWDIMLQAELECLLNVQLFPFDYQQCKIDIASPQYDTSVLRFQVLDQTIAVQLSRAESASSAVWKIIGQTSTALSSTEPGVSFRLLLQRKPTFYFITILLPLLVINIMTAVTFILPGAQHEKMSTGQNPVLVYFIFNVVVYAYMPASDNQPYLNIFLVIQMFLAAGASGVTAFLFKLKKSEKEMKKLGTLEEIRAKHKVLYICNTMNVNRLTMIGYCTCVLSCYLASGLYLGLGSMQLKASASATYNYQTPQVVANAVPLDQQS